MLIARSASNKTNDWPFWMVWDGSRNVTGYVEAALGLREWPETGPGFLPRARAETLAAQANEEAVNLKRNSGGWPVQL